MPVLNMFATPAFIKDIPDTPENKSLNAELMWRWNINVKGWISQATPVVDPSTNPGQKAFFYDPTETDIPDGSETAMVEWNAFPGRLDQFYGVNPPNPPVNKYNLSEEQVQSLANTGWYTSESGERLSLQDIPKILCPQADWTGTLVTFGPYGPRGWLDEYCEWSAVRDDKDNLVRIDFTCENPEYWTTLWKVSPERVVELYNEILNWQVPAERQVNVTLADLQLTDGGKAVIDPETGRPAYNPLNKWNSGPVASRTGQQSGFFGGAIHLTSTPNTLQTELGLAGASTVQFPSVHHGDSQALICCGQYGQEYRHSDPFIGLQVNTLVSGGYQLCLANPVGLYIQELSNLNAFGFAKRIDPSKFPEDKAQAWNVFQALRGQPQVTDPVTKKPFPGAMILHAVCQIPPEWLKVYPDMTLIDIEIKGTPITWAGQVARQFSIGLFVRPLKSQDKPLSAPCEAYPPPAAPPSVPLQSLMYTNLWNAYYKGVEMAPTGQPMSLASNTTFIAPILPPDGQPKALTLTVTTPSTTASPPKVAVLLPNGKDPDPSIKVTVLRPSPANYAVPGNSYPGSYTALALEVTIPAGATPGLRGVMVSDPDPGSGGGGSLPAALVIGSGA